MSETAVGKSSGIVRSYGPYVQADWGFANHWYPGVYAHEVEERGVVGITIGGHDIAVTRDASGKAWAINDRCVHRGVKMSAKPTCFADKTISCWYHGYTYDAETGNLATIIGSPDDKLIGTVGVQRYPTEEFAGIIWVFVGDKDFGDPPPIMSDLPIKVTDKDNAIPHLMDEDCMALGIRRKLHGNWRLAVENGLDPGHLLVHWDNQIIVALDRAMPLGMKALRDDATELIDIPDGPKGVMNRYDKPENYEPILENPMVEIKARGNTQYEVFRVSAWVPGILMVENWPTPGIGQYEFYVPIDDHNHMYFEIIVDHGTTAEEWKDFQFRFDNFYKPLGLLDFNDRDIMARDATEEFYQRNDGWNNETLSDMDYSVVAWRRHSSKFGRGFFQSPYLDEE